MNTKNYFFKKISKRPAAIAQISGSPEYSSVNGTVRFFRAVYGVFVVAQISGLPTKNQCTDPIFGFHIHEGMSCSGDAKDPFAGTGMHYNPNNCAHPYHAGDLPPLFGANGYAYSAVLTDRFTVDEIIGKTVIIHSSPDDFSSQPSGNSGKKIGCGVIVPC